MARNRVLYVRSPSHQGEMYTISSQGRHAKASATGRQKLEPSSQIGRRREEDCLRPIPCRSARASDISRRENAGYWTWILERSPTSHRAPNLAIAPRWSPDGRYILEVAIDHNNMMLLDLQTSRWSQLNLHRGALISPVWSHDGRCIYFGDFATPSAVSQSGTPGTIVFL